MASHAIPTKKKWALFKDEDGQLKCRQIHQIDKVYVHFSSSKSEVIYCIPKSHIVSTGTLKKMKEKYPEYMI